MKIDKRLKEMPWGTVQGLSDRQPYQVTVQKKKNVSGYIYIAEFIHNPEYRSYGFSGEDFRVYVSKKERDFDVLTRNAKKKKDYNVFLPSHPRYIYAEISREDEEMLRVLTGKESDNHQMETLYDLCMEYKKEKRIKQARARGEFLDDDIKLCPEDLPEGLEGWIRAEVLPNDYTLIYKKGNARGRCAVCGREVRRTYKKFIQHQTVHCPDCGSEVICIREGSAAWQSDYVQNLVFAQRGRDGESVWIRQFHLCRDYKCEYTDMKQYLVECARYAVRGKHAAMWLKERKESTFMGRSYPHRLNDWERSQRIYIYDGYGYKIFPGGFEEATAGTRLRYIETDLIMNERDPLKLMLDIIRYPCLEFLIKNGYEKLLRAKVNYGLDKNTQNVCRWQADSVKDFFKIPMRILRHEEPAEWTARALKCAEELWQSGLFSDLEIAEIALNEAWKPAVTIACEYKPVQSILSYIKIGEEKTKDYGFSSIYKDYLDECRDLGFNLRDKNIIFPKNLQAAHERTSALVTEKKNEIDRKKFQAVVKPLREFEFEADGLMIFPAASSAALAREGAALHHCVGTYAKRMSKGQTAIFFIRKIEDPRKSFFTLEYKNGKIEQCRGMQNRSYTEESAVKAFTDKWLKFIEKKRREKKCRKSA